ncbi:hypothetical protein B5S29_g4902 [[Candida] boidinii]|nr:hypothetical protein B5S29_g4902 [[Candida] boidinii]
MMNQNQFQSFRPASSAYQFRDSNSVPSKQKESYSNLFNNYINNNNSNGNANNNRFAPSLSTQPQSFRFNNLQKPQSIPSQQQTQQSLNNKSKPKKPYNYKSIFDKVLQKRLKYYGRISFGISILVSIILTILNPNSKLYYIPIKIILIWTGFISIRFANDLTIKFESNGYQNLSLQILNLIFSNEFLINLLAYFISTLTIKLNLIFI